ALKGCTAATKTTGKPLSLKMIAWWIGKSTSGKCHTPTYGATRSIICAPDSACSRSAYSRRAPGGAYSRRAPGSAFSRRAPSNGLVICFISNKHCESHFSSAKTTQKKSCFRSEEHTSELQSRSDLV